jgi:hypothetical protein
VAPVPPRPTNQVPARGSATASPAGDLTRASLLFAVSRGRGLRGDEGAGESSRARWWISSSGTESEWCSWGLGEREWCGGKEKERYGAVGGRLAGYVMAAFFCVSRASMPECQMFTPGGIELVSPVVMTLPRRVQASSPAVMGTVLLSFHPMGMRVMGTHWNPDHGSTGLPVT